jgi:single-strand DNA-binding protein
MPAAAPAPNGVEHVNEVHLVGRLAAEPTERIFPSGDPVLSWRLVVDRPRSSRATKQTVDVLQCSATLARVRKSAATWLPGDIVELDGALLRRFWRGPSGPQSAYEVHVHTARRLSRASAA